MTTTPDNDTGQELELATTAELVMPTPQQARSVTERIRANIAEAHRLIILMYQRQGWHSLGYASWEAYLAGEFGEGRLPREYIGSLDEAGMSARAIAPAVGLSHATVSRAVAVARRVSDETLAADKARIFHTLAIEAVPVEHTPDVIALIADVDPLLHPARRLLPWMNQGELLDMAESIQRMGLLHPITMTPDGLMIDGKIRWVACHMAGVEPAFETHIGDPVTFCLSQNFHRANRSPSQRAMAYAMLGDRSHALGELVDWAAEIATQRPDWVERICDGSLGVREAYADLIATRLHEDRRREDMRLLQSVAPDVVFDELDAGEDAELEVPT